MPRRYTVVFEKIAVSAVQDLLAVKGATGKTVRIIDYTVICVDTTAPANTQMALRCSYLPATVTDGSAGAAVTPRPADPGDAAATATARRNDTTPATSSGTKVTLRESGCNVYQGDQYTFPAPPIIAASTQFVLEIITTPAAALTLSGSVTFEEIG